MRRNAIKIENFPRRQTVRSNVTGDEATASECSVPMDVYMEQYEAIAASSTQVESESWKQDGPAGRDNEGACGRVMISRICTHPQNRCRATKYPEQ